MAVQRIVDGDGHVFEDIQGIARFVPDAFQEILEASNYQMYPTLDPFRPSLARRQPGSFGGGKPVGPKEWMEFMETVGIETTILYPTAGLAYGNIPYAEWAITLARAYNDWLAEQYLSKSPRFQGLGLIPMQEPEAALEELRRIVTELGMVGAMLPSNGLNLLLGAKQYWPVYREAERLGCCLAVHGGNHGNFGFNGLPAFAPAHALGHPYGIMNSLASILFNGIFDKFPNIRIGFMEAGVAWLLMVLERFAGSYDAFHYQDSREELARFKDNEKVSDYLIRQIQAGRLFVGCEGDEPALAYAVKVVGNEPFVYSSDFPHEVTSETCRKEIEELIENEDLTQADKGAILAHNAERFYRLRPSAATAGAGERAGIGRQK